MGTDSRPILPFIPGEWLRKFWKISLSLPGINTQSFLRSRPEFPFDRAADLAHAVRL